MSVRAVFSAAGWLLNICATPVLSSAAGFQKTFGTKLVLISNRSLFHDVRDCVSVPLPSTCAVFLTF